MDLSGLRRAKMERISETLQLPVIVEGRRPLALELPPLEKLDFHLGRGAAEGGILQEFPEPRLFHEELIGLPFYKREARHVSSDHSGVQYNHQTERREVDIPGFEQRIQERDAVLGGQVEDVRIEELEHDHAHLFMASAAELGHHVEPVVVLQLL